MKIITWFFLGMVVLILLPQIISASEVDDRIGELQKKIIQLQGQEDSLGKQINLLNSQISLTSLRIDSIRTAIARLTLEIDELAGEIDRIESLLTKRSELILRRIPESYKRKTVSDISALFLSQNFSDLLSRVKYVSRVQEQDVQLLFQLKATQSHFSERKSLREEKKTRQETLRVQLEQETKELETQKKSKETLLSQTKNNELTYQQLLSQALAEKQAVDRALVEGVKLGPVKKGDPIGLVGNSGYPGCSTGAHLHFEVRKNNAWLDLGQYLSAKTVVDDQDGGSPSFGRGSWDWPLQDTIRITQHFGKTPYSWRYSYSGGIHTGYDMISTTSNVIRAPQDGTLFISSQACGGSSIIKIKYIDQGDGIITFYLHVQ